MANPDHLEMLRSGVKAWKAWRKVHREIRPDLRDANLRNLNLKYADLHYANLEDADLRHTNLSHADLRYANLKDAVLRDADLSNADLSNADLSHAILSRANLTHVDLRKANLPAASLRRANLRGANLTGANLRHASLVLAHLQGARLSHCEVYGVGAWDLEGTPADQSDLRIQAADDKPIITVDNLAVAQFLSLLWDNRQIASVIDTVSERTILILGRFTKERKEVLDSIKQRLMERNFVPILFDFAKPEARDLTETIMTLAQLACFVIADLTQARSLPQELSYIVPYLPSVPVIPIIAAGHRPYALFEHFRRYPWVLPVVEYKDREDLLSLFDDKVLKVGYSRLMQIRGKSHKPLPRVIPPGAAAATQPRNVRSRSR